MAWPHIVAELTVNPVKDCFGGSVGNNVPSHLQGGGGLSLASALCLCVLRVTPLLRGLPFSLGWASTPAYYPDK